MRNLEDSSAPYKQYQIIDKLINNFSDANLILKSFLISNYPLIINDNKKIFIPNCYIRAVNNFHFKINDEDKSIVLSEGIFIIKEELIQTLEEFTIELNNINHYLSERSNGIHYNTKIYLMATFNPEEHLDLFFGLISNYLYFLKNKEHNLLILDIEVDTVNGYVTKIHSVNFHNIDEDNEFLSSNKIVDAGWVGEVPSDYFYIRNYSPSQKTTKIKIKESDHIKIKNYIPEEGELVWVSDTKRLVIGDGQTLGGNNVIEGNVDFLEPNKYYGTNDKGERGFYNIPYYYDVRLSSFSTTNDCKLILLYDYLPVFQISSKKNKIQVFVPYNLKDKLSSIILDICYVLNGSNTLQKEIKFLYKVWVISNNNLNYDNLSCEHVEQTLISSNMNLEKICKHTVNISFLKSYKDYQGIIIEINKLNTNNDYEGYYNIINFRIHY